METLHSKNIGLIISFYLTFAAGHLPRGGAEDVQPTRTSQPDQSLTEENVQWFEQKIRPLLIARCYECHSEQQNKRDGNLVLDSRRGWETGGDSGPVVIPGNSAASLLMDRVRSTNAEVRMPPKEPLTAAEIDLLDQWIQRGAPDPRTGDPQPRKTDVHPSDPIAGRSHWAFQPLSDPDVPQTSDPDWAASPIDAFILQKLETANLKPSEEADRVTLLRRTFYQLTGLPPTPSQATEFLNDARLDAYEHLVDRLLNSPQYGERWGRHWLDLARYADSNGLDENFLFREAWRYRNWVIQAVNDDIPFDRFLLEQIAGDLLPFDSVEQRDRQRIAAGFLVLGPKVLLGNDDKERVMDVADEQLDTIGRAVLGQTLGCARCHDHKFDPIPTADYYALAGILTSTQVLEQRYMLGQQRVMEQLVGLSDDGQLDDAYEKYWREQPGLKDRRKRAKEALELLQKDDLTAFNTFAEQHANEVAASAKNGESSKDDRIEAQKQLVKELDDAAANPPPIPPRAMVPADGKSPQDEFVRIAGRFSQKGEQVARGFLQVIGDSTITIPDNQSGRIELARWLTDVDHGAGRLTARVMANRIWHHMISRGIVRTVDNFGRTGESPTHPELLDHLANELIQSGWSIRSLVRTIALSRTFRMSSAHDEIAHTVDPENALLWRANRRRLDPEALRDSMLAAAGTLDLNPMDSTVAYLGDQATAVGANTNRRRTDFPCRSVYLPVIRNDLPEIFDVFNFADPQAATGSRPNTMVATQGLFLMNDESVIKAARETAERILKEAPSQDPEVVAAFLFQLVFQDDATSEWRESVAQYVQDAQQQTANSNPSDSAVSAWALAVQAVFASSRFQIVE
ncbi:MAG: PSD1 and planctomycete cytochrome C domain-containing protein [Planctomycetaceae bacterium]